MSTLNRNLKKARIAALQCLALLKSWNSLVGITGKKHPLATTQLEAARQEDEAAMNWRSCEKNAGRNVEWQARSNEWIGDIERARPFIPFDSSHRKAWTALAEVIRLVNDVIFEQSGERGRWSPTMWAFLRPRLATLPVRDLDELERGIEAEYDSACDRLPFAGGDGKKPGIPISKGVRRPRKKPPMPNAARDKWVAEKRALKNPWPWDEIYDEAAKIAKKRGWSMPTSAKSLAEAHYRYLKRQRNTTAD
jgi:hypothetical protein